MELIIQLIVGGVIGWLGSIVMKTNAQMGMIANIIVGSSGPPGRLAGWPARRRGTPGHGLDHGRRRAALLIGS